MGQHLSPLRAVLLATAIVLMTVVSDGIAATMVLQPNADTEAASDQPKSNFGYNATLRIDTKRIAYLRFDLAALYGATVQNARLRVYPVNNAPGVQTVQQMAESPWTETGLTWKNRPTKVDRTLSSFGPATVGNLITVDVTAGVAAYAGRSLTLAIAGTNSLTLFLSSRQAAQNKPELEIDYLPAYRPTPSADFSVGINLAGPTYWATEVPYLNLMKLSGGWYTQCYPYGSSPDPLCAPGSFPRSGASTWDTLEQDLLVLDADGMPMRLPDPARSVEDGVAYTRVTALLPAGLSANRPSGRVIVRYDGAGQIQYALNGSLDAQASVPGRHVLNVRSSPGAETSSSIQVIITATDPSDYIRNIRVVPEGGVCSNDSTLECDPANPGGVCGSGLCRRFEDVVDGQSFHPRFLANLKRFSAIRTMEFQNTNSSLITEWAARTRPSSVRWTAAKNSDGAPLEVIAEMANTLGVDVWVNVPHRASNDFINQMAALFLGRLNPSRRVLLEYANEAWNTAFSAGSWMETQAVAAWPSSTLSPYTKRLNWYGRRSVEVCQIWKQVWGVQSARTTCVAGAQAVSTDGAEAVLDCPLYADTRGGRPCYADLDGLAVAPYFGHYLGVSSALPEVEAWTQASDGGLETLFLELSTGGQLQNRPNMGGAVQEAMDDLQRQVATARDRGLPLFGYEAGQHLVGVGSALNSAALTNLFIAANGDARMGQLYRRYLEGWQISGGGPVVLYDSVGSYSQWGSWGLLEYRDQTGSPKFDAVQQFLDTLHP